MALSEKKKARKQAINSAGRETLSLAYRDMARQLCDVLNVSNDGTGNVSPDVNALLDLARTMLWMSTKFSRPVKPGAKIKATGLIAAAMQQGKLSQEKSALPKRTGPKSRIAPDEKERADASIYKLVSKEMKRAGIGVLPALRALQDIGLVGAARASSIKKKRLLEKARVSYYREKRRQESVLN